MLKELDLTVSTPEASEHLARALLTLINATSFSIPDKGLPYMCASLVERLSKSLTSMNCDQNDEPLSDGESRAWYYSHLLYFCLDNILIIPRFLVFLRLVSLHQLERKHEHITSLDQARLFFALLCLLQKQSVQNWEDISELLQDMMCRISDGRMSSLSPDNYLN